MSVLHEFDATLQVLEGKMPWTVFYVPFSVPELYGTSGRLNVRGAVDGLTFSGVLLPSRNGHYLVFNSTLRRQCGKQSGDTVHVQMEVDGSQRTVDIPPGIRQSLEGLGLLEAFAELPYYIKREEINRIESAKREETKQKRMAALMDKLRG